MDKTKHSKDPARSKTQPEGQNPKANDSPDRDEYHDDNRRNMYDAEVAESLRGPTKKK